MTIPVSGISELLKYQKAVLGILNKIEIEVDNHVLNEDLKFVYKLLGHFLLDHSFLSRHVTLLNEYNRLLKEEPKNRVSNNENGIPK